MKKKRIKMILWFTALVMIFTIIISFIIDSKSQKLPAVVKCNKVFISTEVSGTVVEYLISPMQEVNMGDTIAVLENPRFIQKLQTLQKEYENYSKLVDSATNGDYLEIELYKIDEDLVKYTTELNKSEYKLQKISNSLNVISAERDNMQKKYESIKSLYDQNLISLEEYEDKSDDLLDVITKYNTTRSESLFVFKEIKAYQNLVKMQNSQKKILENNSLILTSKNQAELDKIKAEIDEVTLNISNLVIVSPLDGVVTDLRNRPGEKVKNGDVIAEISDVNNIWLTAYGNSLISKKLKINNKVVIFASNREKIVGKIISISPVMEKVKSLSASYETVNTYSKIDVAFENTQQALANLSPGERLFVRINLGK